MASSFSRFLQKVILRAEVGVLKILIQLLLWWPRKWQKACFFVIYPIFRIRKDAHIKRVAQHLELADLPRKPTVADIYADLLVNGWDSLRYLCRPQQIPLVWRYAEILCDELGAARPVVAISIHCGAFEIMHRALTEFGAPVHLVHALNFPPAVNQVLQQVRAHPSVELHRPAASPQLLRRLQREGGILALMVDQAREGKGNVVDLLGRPTYLWLRLALKAHQMGASVILLRTFRQNQQHIISFEKVFNTPCPPQIMINEISLIIAEWIRETPTQWTWNYPRLWNLT